MLDFYGQPYEQSRWHWDFWAWSMYQRIRTIAVVSWIKSTLQRLDTLGYAVNVQWNNSQTGDWAPRSEWALVHLPQVGHELGILLSANHYDTLTKQGLDPARWVIMRAEGQKWVEDNTKGN